MPQTDLTQMPPQDIARQLACPEGEAGQEIAKTLNASNAKIYAQAYKVLDLKPNETILEIGFGNGHLIPEILEQAKGLHYCGLEISQTMAEEAKAHNKTWIEKGAVKIQHGSSSALPYKESAFDTAIAMNVIYFWKNPKTDLSEIRRTLKPGGRLLLGIVSPPDLENCPPPLKYGFRFYDQDQIRDLLTQSGFRQITFKTVPQTFKFPDGREEDQDYYIVTASPNTASNASKSAQ